MHFNRCRVQQILFAYIAKIGKQTRYIAEALLFILTFTIFRMMPLDMASACGAWIGRLIGVRLKAQHIALRNLSQIMPEHSADARKNITHQMWAHFGRNIAEFCHLNTTTFHRRIIWQGEEHLPEHHQPALFISAHFGMWDAAYAYLYQQGHQVALIYRIANNPYCDRFINAIRKRHCTTLIPKGSSGKAQLLRALKQRYSFALLVDQKMNSGISVPFMGKPAMTTPSVAELALRYQLPIIPMNVVRTQGARFVATIYPPLEYTLTGDKTHDVHHITEKMNLQLEAWIRDHPEQWFWMHKRWAFA